MSPTISILRKNQKKLQPQVVKEIINFPETKIKAKGGSDEEETRIFKEFGEEAAGIREEDSGNRSCKGESSGSVVLDENRMQKSKLFSFQSSYEGYNETLWEKLRDILGSYSPENLFFAACGVRSFQVVRECNFAKSIFNKIKKLQTQKQ